MANTSISSRPSLPVDKQTAPGPHRRLRQVAQSRDLGGGLEVAEVFVDAEFHGEPESLEDVAAEPSDSPGSANGARKRRRLEFVQRGGDELKDVRRRVWKHRMDALAAWASLRAWAQQRYRQYHARTYVREAVPGLPDHRDVPWSTERRHLSRMSDPDVPD
jgi:hypothetical protein